MHIKITAFALSFCFFPLMIATNQKNQDDLDRELLEAVYDKKDKKTIKKLVEKGANFSSNERRTYFSRQPTTAIAIIMHWKSWHIMPYFITEKIDLETVFNCSKTITNCLSEATIRGTTESTGHSVITDLLIANAHVRSSRVKKDPLATIHAYASFGMLYNDLQNKTIKEIFELYTVIDKMPKFANEFEKYEALITYQDQFTPFNRILFSLFTNNDLKKNGLYSEISRFNTIKFKEFIKNYDSKILKDHTLENSDEIYKKTLAYKLYFFTRNYVTFALCQQDIIEILLDSKTTKELFDLEEQKELTKCHVGKKMSNFRTDYDCIFEYL